MPQALESLNIERNEQLYYSHSEGPGNYREAVHRETHEPMNP